MQKLQQKIQIKGNIHFAGPFGQQTCTCEKTAHLRKKKKPAEKFRDTVFSGGKKKKQQQRKTDFKCEIAFGFKRFQKSEIIGHNFLTMGKPHPRKPNVRQQIWILIILKGKSQGTPQVWQHPRPAHMYTPCHTRHTSLEWFSQNMCFFKSSRFIVVNLGCRNEK